MNTSQSTSSLVKALVLAQKKIKHATKDAKNPHFKNDYATLESVIDASKDHLLEQEIIVVQAINDKSLVTRLVHSSGEFMESSFELLVDKQNMQGLGSAVTYARRYSLAAMLNISQADDDGNEASSKPASQNKTQEKKSGVYELKAGKGKGTPIDNINDQNLISYFNWMKTENTKKPLTGPLNDDFIAVSEEVDKRGLVPF